MKRWIVCFLGTSVILAQAPQREPVYLAIQAYGTAHAAGRFDEAAAKREEARRLLGRAPVEAPQFGGWVQNVAQLYEMSGMSAQARAIVQDALSRLGGSHPARVMLLEMLAGSWEQDRNLLKAVQYREQAVAALEALGADSSPAPGAQARPLLRWSDRPMMGVAAARRIGPFPQYSFEYQQLANIYRRLGRREDVDALLAKLARAGNNDSVLAALYEQDGQLDQAAAIYKRQVEQATDPQQAIVPLQSLTNLYERQQRYGDAVAALEQAIGSLEASGRPEIRNQSIWLRQRLAGILNQAGQPQAADGIYTQLLAETQGGRSGSELPVLTSYANYLATTKRGAQAETLLKDYLANHANLQPGEESSLLFSLANVANLSGQSERAGEYQRAANDKLQARQLTPPGQISIGNDLQRAQSAANGDRLDEAFRVTLRAIEAAPSAPDREQIVWAAPSIASVLANRGAADLAEQLYQRLFEVVQSWSADTLQPLLNLQQGYARFLIQRQRWGEANEAIERYRNTLIAARGAGTGCLEEVVRLTIDSARSEGAREKALAAAQDLLALEEALSGTTSEPYLRAAETLAGILEWNGDYAGALALRRRLVAIADLVFPANDLGRGFTRISTASALANQGQFEEAEELASQAVALAQPAQPNLFTPQLEQIRRMKQPPPPSDSKWFRRQPR